MNNTEIVQQMKNYKANGSGEQGKQTHIIVKKILIFTIMEQKYGLYAEQVKEILTGNQIYYIPFIPPYVRGLINRHGEAYTVIDLKMVFSQEKLDANKYLIMKIPHDQLALMVSDVAGIVDIPQGEILGISHPKDTQEMFSGAFELDGKRVFLIHIETVLKRLENDLSS